MTESKKPNHNVLMLPSDEHDYDALAAIALRQRAFTWNAQGVVRSEVHDRVITTMHDVAKKLIRTKDDLFHLDKDRHGNHVVVASHLGMRLLTIADTSLEFVRAEYPLYRLSPVFMVFASLQRRLPVGISKFLKQPRSRAEAELVLSATRRVVASLKLRLGSDGVKRRSENFRRGAMDRFNGLIDSIDWLAQQRSEVVVLRFDLYYYAAGSQAARFGDEPDTHVLDEFLDYRERFHRSMDHRFGADLVGYAWALEHGRERGFHVHYLVMLRPPGNEGHVDVVEQLGAKWAALTDKQGEVYNVNARAGEYTHRATGLVRLDDPAAVKGLHFIVTYITLAGLFVNLDVRDDLHTFAKGRFPKEPPPKVGRPGGQLPKFRIKISVAEARASYLNFL